MLPFLAYSVAGFFENMVTTFLPNSFMLAVLAFFIVLTLLVMVRVPGVFALVASFITAAVLAGWTNNALGVTLQGISTNFTPVFLLAFLAIAGVVAIGFWTLLRK